MSNNARLASSRIARCEGGLHHHKMLMWMESQQISAMEMIFGLLMLVSCGNFERNSGS